MATELIGIELDLIGEENVYNDLRKLDTLVRSLGGRHTVSLDLRNTRKRMLEVNSEIEKYKRSLAGMNKNDDGFKETQAHLKALQNEYKNLSIRAKEYAMALREHKTFGQMYSNIATKVKHLGSAFTATGNALKAFGRPFQNIMRGSLYTAGYALLNKATEGIAGATERYDIRKTYERSLSALGYDATKKFVIGTSEAKNAVDQLNDAVLGLPTGLDEIMASQKKYLAASGDMVKATLAAIAANNTFLAQGSDARDQLRGARQLRNMLSGSEMTKARWQSVLESMPLAVNEVGKELGYAEKEMDKFRQQLLAGEIDAKDFLNAFLKVGTTGSIRDAVDKTKHTFGAVSANIGNAFRRMGENVLLTLDDVLKKATGKDTIDHLLGIKDAIDSFSQGVQNWIKQNPKVITDFLDAIRSIDFKSFFAGLGEGLKNVVMWSTKLINLLGGQGMSTLGKIMTYAGFLGTPLTIIGGLLKGIGGNLFGIIGALVGRGGQLLGARGGSQKGGLLKRLVDAIGTEKEVTEATTTAKRMTVSLPKFTKASASMMKAFQNIALGAGSVAIVSGTGVIAFKSVKTMLKDLGEIIDIGSAIDWEDGIATMGLIGLFYGAMIKTFQALGAGGVAGLKSTAIGGAITAFGAGIIDIDLALIKRSMSHLSQALDYISGMTEKLRAMKKLNKDKVATKIGNALAVLSTVYDKLKYNPEGGTSINKMSKSEATRAKEIIGSLTSAVESITELSPLMKKIAGKKFVDTATMETVGDKLTAFFDSIGKVFLPTHWANQIKPMPELDMGLKSMNMIFKRVINMVSKIQEMRMLLPSVSDPMHGSMQAITPMLEQMFGALRTIQDKFSNSHLLEGSDMSAKMEDIAGAFSAIPRIIRKMNKISNMDVKYTGASKIKNLIDSLDRNLNVDSLDGIKARVETFKATVDTLMDSLATINGDKGAIEVDLNIKYKDNVKDVTKQIGKVSSTIQSKVNAITTHYYKDIYIHFNTHIGNIPNIPTPYGASTYGPSPASPTPRGGRITPYTGGYASRNGILYRAGGGSVFRPRGTDIIPAMLSEGEYVHNKRAVDMFGLEFMRKVNNLDIRGAMNALLTRAGSISGVGRQNIINHTINNNQRITQNIRTENPQFARLRVGRYAGAL